MFDVFGQISWLGALASFVVLTIFGGVYFGVLVSQRYLVVMGREGEAAPAMAPSLLTGQLVASAGPILASAILVAALDLTTVRDALVLGLIVGIGYLTAMTLQIAINPNFPHPFQYTVLNAPYFLISSLVTAVLLVVV